MSLKCPLCKQTGSFTRLSDRLNRVLNKCENCNLVFVENNHLPSREEEKFRYEQHNNSIEDEGYVQFLMQAIEPALKLFQQNSKGLDYGCGPGPTLSRLLQQRGYACQNYDPIFFPKLPQGPFDFIFATECFEHFFDPAKEIEQLSRLLKNGACLVVMTSLWDKKTDFSNWHYTQDNTHVVFFHENTIQYIAHKYGFEIIFNDYKRIIILRKEGGH
jgi:2-polyprenyl-3-methyl-5-hydroxy-6-metoxy-1,4-benzoquinol methylase